MTCHLTADDTCAEHDTPREDMHDCPHDGLTCNHDCAHPDCHVVRNRRINRGPLGVGIVATCELCGKKSSPGDGLDAQDWRYAHHQEVAR